MKKNSFLNIYKNKKVLVTGSTGFKGSWLTFWLYKLGAKVIGIGLKPEKNFKLYDQLKLKKKIKQYILNIENYEKLNNIIKKEKPDIIFHLAAQSIVSTSFKRPLKTIFTNVLGGSNILEAVRNNQTKALVYVTSDKCYLNNEKKKNYKERDILGGFDNYSASKASAEILFYSYFQSFFKNNKKINVGSARAGNVIGGGDWAEDRIVPDTAKSWIKNKELNIRNPLATRPWQHVLEPLGGYLTLARKLQQNPNLNGEAFNFGPNADESRTVLDLIKELSKYWNNLQYNQDFDNNKFHESNLLKLNCDKALHYLDWKSRLSFKETIEMTANWYSNYYIHKTSIIDFTKKQINFYQNKFLGHRN